LANSKIQPVIEALQIIFAPSMRSNVEV